MFDNEKKELKEIEQRLLMIERQLAQVVETQAQILAWVDRTPVKALMTLTINKEN